MIVFAAFSRIIPHMPDCSPLGAIGLFGAALFAKKWQALLVLIAATWLSDLFINNVIYAQYYLQFTWLYEGWYWIYGTYAFVVAAGIFILKKVNLQRILKGALATTSIFFLVLNFSCFPGSTTYSLDFNRLITCIATGIPFLKRTLPGDLFFSGLLFGALAFAQKKFPLLKLKNA